MNLICLMSLWFVGSVAASDVYRHVDKDGVVHYTDQPPSKNAKPLELPPVQVIGPLVAPEPKTRSKSSRAGSVSASVSQDFSLRIVTPTPDQTFRGDDRRLQVGVSLSEALPEGHGLFYLLDGSPQNRAPSRDLNFTLTGVERGEHLVSVVVVNARGSEIARAGPVIVHMKPPTVSLTQGRPNR